MDGRSVKDNWLESWPRNKKRTEEKQSDNDKAECKMVTATTMKQ